MEYIESVIGILSASAPFGLYFLKLRISKKIRPKVVVTKDGTPPANAGLFAEDGAQFPVNPHNGLAEPSASHIGSMIFIRDLKTKKELARFVLQSGLNEQNI